MYPMKIRESSENWHYDKYKDPLEFPTLDLSSDDEKEGMEARTDSNSSANLSAKLPAVSERRFNEIMAARKTSNRQKKLTNRRSVPSKMDNVPPMAYEDTSDLAAHGCDGVKLDSYSSVAEKMGVQSNDPEKKETSPGVLLSSSTPKVNTIVSGDGDIKQSPRVDKNLSPFLTNQLENETKEETAKKDVMQLTQLLQHLESQTLEINQLRDQLKKTKIKGKTQEADIWKLKNDNSSLLKKNHSLQSKLDMMNSTAIEQKKLLAALKGQNTKLEDQLSVKVESLARSKEQLMKERLLLSKECDVNKTIIENYTTKIEKVYDEKKEIQDQLERQRLETEQWKDKFYNLEKESDTCKRDFAIRDIDNGEKLKTLQTEVKEITDECQKREDEYRELLNKYNIMSRERDNLEESYKTVKNDRDGIMSELDNVRKAETELSVEHLRIKTELTTKLEIVREELDRCNKQNSLLSTKTKTLESDIDRVNSEYSSMKITVLGANPITDEQFGSRYKLLEMDVVDKLTLRETQNIIKNILAALNTKFSTLKENIVFIRDDIFLFFTELHSILHCTHSGNHIILDRSIKLDLSEKEKLKKCMNILTADLKTLKGLE